MLYMGTCDKVSSYEELLASAGLPTLFNRRLQDIAILMFKVKNNLCPQYIANLFKRQQSNHNLRNADFILPRFNTVTYLGPKLWARIPNCVKSVSLKSFKNNIRNSNRARN